ncbi:hypothetical protein [Rathayibacter tanaceti]|uniref:Tetratricopeptide repeat protein n=1 Tax=Rathayibacter tanaceti TaxID=1671680 RepID=A0AAE6RJ34_9MICO|nr:hypothetical protein [Rathayibacter tanaceti]QHC55450.1 hypothetical protein GSU10_07235 [Rathayibacter tanaceti]
MNFDAAYHYRTQIQTNLAQIRWKIGDRSRALANIEENLELASVKHRASRSETLSIAGFYYYLDGQLDRAWSLVSEAYALVSDERAPRRLATVRKIGVGILRAQGRHDEADNLAERLMRDPLDFDAALGGDRS